MRVCTRAFDSSWFPVIAIYVWGFVTQIIKYCRWVIIRRLSNGPLIRIVLWRQFLLVFSFFQPFIWIICAQKQWLFVIKQIDGVLSITYNAKTISKRSFVFIDHVKTIFYPYTKLYDYLRRSSWTTQLERELASNINST